jgi:hypothetical protein
VIAQIALRDNVASVAQPGGHVAVPLSVIGGQARALVPFFALLKIVLRLYTGVQLPLETRSGLEGDSVQLCL